MPRVASAGSTIAVRTPPARMATSALMPPRITPSRLSTRTTISTVRVCVSISGAMRETVPEKLRSSAGKRTSAAAPSLTRASSRSGMRAAISTAERSTTRAMMLGGMFVAVSPTSIVTRETMPAKGARTVVWLTAVRACEAPERAAESCARAPSSCSSIWSTCWLGMVPRCARGRSRASSCSSCRTCASIPCALEAACAAPARMLRPSRRAMIAPSSTESPSLTGRSTI